MALGKWHTSYQCVCPLPASVLRESNVSQYGQNAPMFKGGDMGNQACPSDSFPPRSRLARLYLPACRGATGSQVPENSWSPHSPRLYHPKGPTSPLRNEAPLSEQQLCVFCPLAISWFWCLLTSGGSSVHPTIPHLPPSELWDLVIGLAPLLPSLKEPGA